MSHASARQERWLPAKFGVPSELTVSSEGVELSVSASTLLRSPVDHDWKVLDMKVTASSDLTTTHRVTQPMDAEPQDVVADGIDRGSAGSRIVGGLYMSLNGVVQSEDGWHYRYLDAQMAESIDAQLDSAEAVLLGRRTYVEFADLWPALGSQTRMAQFMNDSPKYVVSRTLKRLTWAGSTLLDSDPFLSVAALRHIQGKDIIVPGSPQLIASLLSCGLLDELRLNVCPIVVGKGMRLFDDMPTSVPLRLVDRTAFDNGVVSVAYRPEVQA